MKKYILLVMLGLFFATSAPAQVVVPDSVAAWYLEKNQERLLLKKDIVILRDEILTLNARAKNEASVITTFQEDITQYRNKVQLKQEELDHKQGELNKLEHEMRKYIFQKWLAYGIALLVIIITLVA